MHSDDFRDIVGECGKLLDDCMGLLADVEFDLSSANEDALEPIASKTEISDMADDVASSLRIKRAESCFVKRHLSWAGPESD
ncbi:MAG: hypothetical protein KGI33_09570 [Thaumarchaeota archaeon]|nr:hypothetical protein [Nitrososphaerota archaeon]